MRKPFLVGVLVGVLLTAGLNLVLRRMPGGEKVTGNPARLPLKVAQVSTESAESNKNADSKSAPRDVPTKYTVAVDAAPIATLPPGIRIAENKSRFFMTIPEQAELDRIRHLTIPKLLPDGWTERHFNGLPVYTILLAK